MEEKNVSPTEQNNNQPVRRVRERIVFRGVQSVVGVAILTATILTLWNPGVFFKTPDLKDLFKPTAQEVESPGDPTAHIPTIGFVSGHWKDNVPGNVCRDGTTEYDLNYTVAYQLQILLEGEGYHVDLFPEFDERLFGYQGDLLIAIYAGSCADDPYPPSGFKIGSSLTVENLDTVDALSRCLVESYQAQTGLPYSFEVIDQDHPTYHIFRDIASQTPAVRFEIGKMSTDSDWIINQTGAVVQGIADGIACYLDQKLQGGVS